MNKPRATGLMSVLLMVHCLETPASVADVKPPAVPHSWRLAADLSFTAEELGRAVRARTLEAADRLSCTSVAIREESADQLLVLCGSNGRLIELGDRRGADAARAVAVVLIDLAQVSLGLPRESLSRKIRDAPGPEPLATTQRRRDILGALGASFARGVQATDRFLPGIFAGLGITSGMLWLSVDVSYLRSRPPRESIEPDLTNTSARLSAGPRWGRWQLGLSATATRVTAARTAAYQRTLLSTGVITRWQVSLVPGIWLGFSAGADAFARRLSVDHADSTVTTTPRVSLRTDAAILWRFGAP